MVERQHERVREPGEARTSESQGQCQSQGQSQCQMVDKQVKTAGPKVIFSEEKGSLLNQWETMHRPPGRLQ